jgi:hypothetical protein
MMETQFDPSPYRQGATSQDLPPIVWLRGDEEYFSEFDMDADAVMQALGIKRSRLTQLSGKELRVGRMRVDRYIRPLYRSVDVQAYIDWSRAPLTQVKSSHAIQHAIDQLENRAVSFEAAMQTLSLDMSEVLRSSIEKLQKELPALTPDQSEGLSQVEYQLVAMQNDLLQKLQFFHDQQQNLLSAIQESQSTQSKSQSTLQDIASISILEIRSLVALTKDLTHQVTSLQNALNSQSDTLDELRHQIENKRSRRIFNNIQITKPALQKPLQNRGKPADLRKMRAGVLK